MFAFACVTYTFFHSLYVGYNILTWMVKQTNLIEWCVRCKTVLCFLELLKSVKINGNLCGHGSSYLTHGLGLRMDKVNIAGKRVSSYIDVSRHAIRQSRLELMVNSLGMHHLKICRYCQYLDKNKSTGSFEREKCFSNYHYKENLKKVYAARTRS